VTKGILVIGASRAGLGTGAALARAAELPLRVWNRSPATAADLVGDEGLAAGLRDSVAAILAVADDALAEVTQRTATLLGRGAIADVPDHFIHLSGATEVSVLKALGAIGRGSRLGALHPLRTFSRREANPQALLGVTCVLEGDEDLVDLLRAWCELAGAHPTRLRSGERARYHAAAALASNAVVALLAECERQMKMAGLDEEAARGGLLRLARGAIEDIPEGDFGLALTGPIVRGDLGVLARHLRVHGGPEQSARVYRVLAQLTLDLAESSRRLDSTEIAAMRALLLDAER
jgi:predicted short-subunit dehydrogenase-like oxidoreductase (DUF2520 family)